MNLLKLGQVFVVALSLAACGGTQESGSCGRECPGHAAGGESECGRHGEEHGMGGEGEATLPPTLAAFHETIAPVWHSEPGAGRAMLACNAAAQLRERAGAVQSGEPSAGADAAAWTPATGALVTSTDALVAACTAQGTDVEVKLTAVHEAFHALVQQARAQH